MVLPVYFVDAFADRPFSGNPAAVVVVEHDLPDETMQAIAAEHNLSETAFVKPGNPSGLRWFTPRVEVPICGHATLAAAFVMATELGRGGSVMAFDTRSGRFDVRREGDLYALDFPALESRPHTLAAGALSRALGAGAGEVFDTGERYVCLVDSVGAVRDLAPDMAALAALDRPGVVVTAPADHALAAAGYDFVSRYFAPAKGVPEDPVTGAAHCALTPIWAARLGRRKLRAAQLSARGGAVACELSGGRVLLTGRARLYLRGQIFADSGGVENSD